MAFSVEEFVKFLNSLPATEEVVVAKEIIDELEASPAEIVQKTGREWRSCQEIKAASSGGLPVVEEKIIFSSRGGV